MTLKPTPDGVVTEEDGHVAITYERRLRHPPERVWTALLDERDLAAWYPCAIHGERRAGTELTFVFADDVMEPTRGTIQVFEPPRRLEYTWDTDVLRFELTPTDEGCLLRFTTIIGDRAVSGRAAAGWQLCLDALARHVNDGEATGPAKKSEWEPLFEQYSALIGGEMAPPPPAAYDALE